MTKKNIVTIDGPSGSGKSTISRLLAEQLKFTYLDTGAMYRAVGLFAQQEAVDLENQPVLDELLANLDLKLLADGHETQVLLNGQDVSFAIRTAEMGMVASKISAVPAVRKKLTTLQKQLGEAGGIVAEGRDMGTVVFPEANHKFYLSATPEERAQRRTNQLEEQGMPADYDKILMQIKKRDHDDSSRSIAPLKPAADALIVDSSEMTINQVTTFMLNKVISGA